MKRMESEVAKILSEPLSGNHELLDHERIKRLQEIVLKIARTLDTLYLGKEGES